MTDQAQAIARMIREDCDLFERRAVSISSVNLFLEQMRHKAELLDRFCAPTHEPQSLRADLDETRDPAATYDR